MRKAKDSYKEVTLKKKVYELAKDMVGRDHLFQFGQDQESSAENQLQTNLLVASIGYIGGVIDTQDIAKFKKMVIRTTRA